MPGQQEVKPQESITSPRSVHSIGILEAPLGELVAWRKAIAFANGLE